jgi:hypothetical protein
MFVAKTGRRTAGRLSVHRLALTGAATSAILFLLAWLAGRIAGADLASGYVELFSRAPFASAVAAAEGLIWSWVFGATAGTVAALVHNHLARRDRR